MPVKDGFAAAKEIKQAQPNIPILLISTHHDFEIVQESKITPVQGFISKFHLRSTLLRATDALLKGETFFMEGNQSE